MHTGDKYFRDVSELVNRILSIRPILGLYSLQTVSPYKQDVSYRDLLSSVKYTRTMGLLFQGGERLKKDDHGNQVCGGCHELVNPGARICAACGSELHTVRGRLGRRLGALFGLLLLAGSTNQIGTTGTMYQFLGVTLLLLSLYWYLVRPVVRLVPLP